MIRLDPTERPLGPINSFEAGIFVAVCGQGIAILTGLGDSSSVEQALGAVLTDLWAGLYALGGGFAITGYTWPGSRWTGVEIKRVGLVAVFFGAIIYALAAIELGARGVPTAILHLAIAVACGVRFVQVSRRLLAARRILGGRGESEA